MGIYGAFGSTVTIPKTGEKFELTFDSTIKDVRIDPAYSYPIKELSLFWNDIRTVKPFSTLTNLESLLLNGNSIKSLDLDDFSKLTKLSLLQLSHNDIDMVTRSSEGVILSDLHSLYLSHNRLTTFNLDLIKDSSKLRYLMLNGNKLTSLEYTTKPTVMFPNLLRLTIDANNFECKEAQQLITDLKKIDYTLAKEESCKSGKKLLENICCNK